MSNTATNLLLKDVKYAVEQTPNGVWRRFVYPNGNRFAEFKSHRRWAGLPLVHYTYGVCPETGKRNIAYGIVAIGRVANGVIAVGQVATGLIAIGQLSIGVLLGVGQAAFATVCVGQLALGLLFGAGQFATGVIALGQFAFGGYVIAQMGWGSHVSDVRGIDPIAKDFFMRLIGK
jgi:hypothetical protein